MEISKIELLTPGYIYIYIKLTIRIVSKDDKAHLTL